jgi:outer membrane protein assembly factor BamD (BamD/ComL family)
MTSRDKRRKSGDRKMNKLRREINQMSFRTRRVSLVLRRLRESVSASLMLRVACFVSAATATVIGCGWIGTEHSVRFHPYQTEREMGRLPPLPTLANGRNDLPDDRQKEEDWQVYYDASEQRAKEIEGIWEQAETAEQRGNLSLARTLLSDYLSRTTVSRYLWDTVQDRQSRRNSAIDRLDAMTALGRGSRASSVQAYLAARRAYDNPGAAENDGEAVSGEDETGVDKSAEQLLAYVPTDENLRDNVAYLRAALSYQNGDYADAAAAFGKLARQYPRSEKREAALYMVALSTMKLSDSFTGTSGDEAHLRQGAADAGETTVEGNTEEKVSADATLTDEEKVSTDATSTGNDAGNSAQPAQCCDDAWRAARRAFNHLLESYPRGRYSSDARGWNAYLLLRADDRAGALAEYYRLLGDERDRNARVEAAFSLTFVRHHATDEEMRRVEAELEDEPSAALAYAYHNVYNYSVDPGCRLRYDYPDNEWEAKKLEEKKTTLQREELKHIVAFASRAMQHYRNASIGGGFSIRVAGANLELGENRLALEQSSRALSLNVKADERARALWIKGVALHRLHDYAGARRTLQTLLEENPQGEFTEDARRRLAMVAEDDGDIDAALEQYLILKYDVDVAYLIDVLMTPHQLEDFIEQHPNIERRDELLYALGIRYKRARLWDSARKAFRRVRTVPAANGFSYSAPEPECNQLTGFKYNCSDPKETDVGPGVTSRLLLNELRTIDELERHEREVASAEVAEDDEAGAEALYQLASYQYQSSEFLFYNGVAWKGERHWNLSALESNNTYRVTGEAETLWRYMQEHETIARALVIYLDVVRRFPRTRAARDAFYTAAVCHERLADYNEYWRFMYAAGLHAGDRMVTYRDVRAAYPAYQLPRGTLNWEPSTRTVDGGPGWAAPPKPQPRLSWRERLKLFGARLWEWLFNFWKQYALGWLEAVLTILSAFFAAHFATRTRKLLRLHLARHRSRRTLTRPLRRWLAANREGRLKNMLREETRALVRRTMRQSLRLVLHPRGRLILLANLLSHSLLIALLAAAMQALGFI